MIPPVASSVSYCTRPARMPVVTTMRFSQSSSSRSVTRNGGPRFGLSTLLMLVGLIAAGINFTTNTVEDYRTTRTDVDTRRQWRGITDNAEGVRGRQSSEMTCGKTDIQSLLEVLADVHEQIQTTAGAELKEHSDHQIIADIPLLKDRNRYAKRGPGAEIKTYMDQVYVSGSIENASYDDYMAFVPAGKRPISQGEFAMVKDVYRFYFDVSYRYDAWQHPQRLYTEVLKRLKPHAAHFGVKPTSFDAWINVGQESAQRAENTNSWQQYNTRTQNRGWVTLGVTMSMLTGWALLNRRKKKPKSTECV